MHAMEQIIADAVVPGKKQKSAPSGAVVGRTCLGCGVQHEKQALLRFVCAPSGEVLLDYTGRAPGRGVYVCCDVLCLGKALRVVKLCHAFRQEVIVPDLGRVGQDVRKLLYRRLGAYLGMSQKAGGVVSGHHFIQRAFLQARVFYMILAEDIAMRRAEEYCALCIQYAVPYVRLFTKEELGHMLGRSSRSAVGLTAPHFLEPLSVILNALERLQTTRGTRETQASCS